jgi:hypothetical protein
MAGQFACQVPGCDELIESKQGYASHLRAHVRRGEITSDEYEALRSDEDKRVLLSQEEVRRLRAEASRWKRIAEQLEQDLEFIDRVTAIVQDSLDALPPVEPPKIVTPDEYVQDEVALLNLSDVHVGKKTATYNHHVFEVRMEKLMQGIASVISIQRHVRPIKKIVVTFNGDIIDAESIYPSQAVDGVSAHILDQIFTYGVPAFMRFLEFLLGLFEEVEIHAVKGNHGNLNPSKWTSAKSTNWDLVFYHALKVAMRNQERIDWNIYDNDWKAMFHVFDYGVLATHGDMIRMYYNTPTYGISRQATRWQATYDDFGLDFFLFGHFHTLILRERFNQVLYTVNGSFVTDDEFAEEKMGVGSEPEQAIFGIHPERGWTWSYPLQLV